MPNPNRAMARQPKVPMVDVTDWNVRPDAVGETRGWMGECNAKEVAESMRKQGVKGASARSWKGSGRVTNWKVMVPWNSVPKNVQENNAANTTMAACVAAVTPAGQE